MIALVLYPLCAVNSESFDRPPFDPPSSSAYPTNQELTPEIKFHIAAMASQANQLQLASLQQAYLELLTDFYRYREGVKVLLAKQWGI